MPPQISQSNSIPPPPPGYTLDSGSVPPPPAGYTLDSTTAAHQPGFFKRLGQNLGIPTSTDELSQLGANEESLPLWQRILPHAPGSKPSATESALSTIFGPVVPAAKSVIGNAASAVKDATQESFDAGENIGSGQPILPNVGKMGYAGVRGVLKSLPFVGPAVQAAGEDVGPMPEGHFLYNPNGNYRGAAGDAAAAVAQVAAPELMDRAAPVFRGIASDLSDAAPNLATKAKAVGSLAAQDALTHVPVLGRLVRRPSFGDYADAFSAQADPQLGLFNKTPKLGDAPLQSASPLDRPVMASANADAAATEDAQPLRGITSGQTISPSPYRLSGDQLTDASTATPKQIIPPERQLPPAPEATTPPARGVTQPKTPYVPGAVTEPAPFLTFHGAEDGETAALMQLTHTGGAALRRIATARGLKIPAAADNVSIINKIQADLSPEEIQSFADAAKARAQDRATSLENVDPAIVSDNKAIAQQLYDKADEMQAAGESPYKIRAWRTAGESIETRPTPVRDLLSSRDALKTIRGVDSKMAAHIQEVTGAQPAQPPAQTPAAPAPSMAQPPRGITQAPQAAPQVATPANTEDLLQQSIAQAQAKRGVTQPQPAETPAAAPADRRLPQNANLRKTVAEMTPDERAQALLTSDKTDLPNRRAFDEAEQTQPAKAIGMSDADGLKALNDTFGYDAGNALLKAKGEALKEAGLDAYHDKGDEFMFRGDSPEDLKTKLETARDILKNRIIQVETADGKQLQFKGADFSYGTGQNASEAETGLKSNKAEREASGQRARGHFRGITKINK